MSSLIRRAFYHSARAAAAGLALLVAGCGSDDFVLWSPDGQQAYVNAAHPMLVDSAGRMVGPALAENERVAGWMPDSQRILVVRAVEPANWAEYAQLLGTDRAATVTSLARQLAALIEGYHDDWTKFGADPAVKVWQEYLDFRGEEIDCIAYYLDQTRPGLLAPLVEAGARIVKEKREDTSGQFLSEGPHVPHIAELHLRPGLTAEPAGDQRLLRLPDPISWACAAPLGRAVAVVTRVAGAGQLSILSLAPNATPIPVDAGVASAAWSPDGRTVAYAKNATPGRFQSSSVQLGTITSVTVCTAAGDPLPAPEGSAECASLLLPENPHVSWLPDGRILFASVRLTVPALIDTTPPRLTLFAVHPVTHTAVDSLVPDRLQAQLPGRADCFALSPDGKKVALPDDTGAVAVFFLETGQLLPLQAEIPKLKGHSDYSAMIPAWRTSEELCYVVPAGDALGSPARAEVVLTTLKGEKRTLSRSWPAARFLPPKLDAP